MEASLILLGIGNGCVPLGGSGSGFVIQDHSDHGVPKERDFGSYDQLRKSPNMNPGKRKPLRQQKHAAKWQEVAKTNREINSQY